MRNWSVLLLLVMMAAPAAADTGLPVRVGYLSDLSGPTSTNDGEDAVFAARMAINDYGGKVLGRPIELLSADHAGKPDVGLTILGRWYDSDNVSGVLLGNSTLALAAQPLTQSRNRTVMFTAAVSPELTNKACSPNSVHWITDTYTEANALVKAVMAQGGTSWYFLTVDYAMGKDTQNVATAAILAAGGQVLGSARHPFEMSDFSALLLQAQSSGAKVLGLASSTENTVSALKQLREFNVAMQPVPLYLNYNDVRAAGLDVMQGLLVANPFYWDLNDGTRAWSQRFFAARKKMPTELQSEAYRAMTHYLQAVDAAGTLDGAVVTKKMKDMPIQDAIGTGGYIRADGRVIRDMYLFRVKKPSDSKSQWDIYEVVRRLPGEDAYRPASESQCHLFGPS